MGAAPLTDPPATPGTLACEIRGEPGRLGLAWSNGAVVLVIDQPGVVRLDPKAARLLVQRLLDLLPVG